MMKSKRKILIIFGVFVFLIFIGFLLCMPIRQNAKLRSLEYEVANISLPVGIEQVAIKSAIGDSGGNGDYSTLRVVLAVKTELNKTELNGAIKNMGLRFSKHYKNSDNIPIFYVTHCDSSKFQSPRCFTLVFDELKTINDYSKYYFIEFVE